MNFLADLKNKKVTTMHNNQSSYNLWTWIVAILLALLLLWMILTGRGPSNACCGVIAATPVTPVETVTPAVAPTTEESFSFNANCQEITHTGNAANVLWLEKSDNLKSMLCSVDGISASGDGKTIALNGSVNSEDTKQKLGNDVQAFFGSDTVIDNQITVSMAEAAAEVSPPEAAKLYFATGKSALPSDSSNTLAPIITWINDHPEAKAIISGYHDARGNKERNEKLAKTRAQSTYDALITAGVSADKIEMRKPSETEGDGNLDEARRVEITIE
jgi:outer membrane protein OmpA-like peptidoglycan-associated protein